MSASSFPLPVIVPIFKVPTLMSVCLPFHSSRCLFTRVPPLFLLLFSTSSAVSYFPQMPCRATPDASLVTLTDQVWICYFYYFFLFYLYIYPPDSQESDVALIHRVSNYPDLLPEMPRYCCPLVI